MTSRREKPTNLLRARGLRHQVIHYDEGSGWRGALCGQLGEIWNGCVHEYKLHRQSAQGCLQRWLRIAG